MNPPNIPTLDFTGAMPRSTRGFANFALIRNDEI